MDKTVSEIQRARFHRKASRLSVNVEDGEGCKVGCTGTSFLWILDVRIYGLSQEFGWILVLNLFDFDDLRLWESELLYSKAQLDGKSTERFEFVMALITIMFL